MLGVGAIQPLVTHRTETTVAALMRGARVDRWRRVALASVKQSGRAVVPEVRMPLSLDAYLGDPAPALRMMLVEPAADAAAESLHALASARTPADVSLIVGPEGGWTELEWTTARAGGVRLFTLGHRTLRADAVPIAAISVLNFLWAEPRA
jgi:16S rRNA (uracil1498-N3)-methyltransferase